jgi:PIN domain
VIYVDSSVALAQLLFETRAPPAWLWRESLVSSRLLEYELWNRVHAYHLTGTRDDDVRAMLALVDMIEMTGPVLARALEPFPVTVRTLDGLHLATLASVRRQASEAVELASYDDRMLAAARALGIGIAAL